MARLIAVVLLLTLALAPAASAEPQGRGELPFAGWFDAIWDALDRVFSWVPTIRSEPRKSGAYIVPDGLQSAPQGGVRSAPRASGAYIVPDGIHSAPQASGAYIVPDGIRADPRFPGSRRLQGRASLMTR